MESLDKFIAEVNKEVHLMPYQELMLSEMLSSTKPIYISMHRGGRTAYEQFSGNGRECRQNISKK